VRDPTSFDEFYSASARRLTSQLYAITGDRSEAEDAVQEAFARAWQHWGRVAGYADPEGWVRTVAIRISVSAWRKAVNRSSAQRRQGPAGELPGLSPDYVAIITALRQIPLAQRQAIVLHHLVGLTVEEIARQGRLPAGTVKAQLARGRRALQPLLFDGQPAEFQPGAGQPRRAWPGGGPPSDGLPSDGQPGGGQPGGGLPSDGGKPGAGLPGDGQPGDGKPGNGLRGEGVAADA